MFCDLFNVKLIDLSIRGSTQQEVFECVTKQLIKEEMVSTNYLEAITKRESLFPTGLMTQHLNIALPHSDPNYIKTPFVFVARLEQPIVFRQMGDNQEMLVTDCFFLGITNGKEQVGLLQAFMNLFMNKVFVTDYMMCHQEKEVYHLFCNNIKC